MELLFKREQTAGKVGRVNFKLWGKIEVTEDEQALIRRYQFSDVILIGEDDSQTLQAAIKWGLVAFVFAAGFVAYFFSGSFLSFFVGIVAGGGVGYWYMNERRETILVQDLLLGRHFVCKSVVDLAKKEALLEGACALLRQVMEGAKHWDGVETHTINPLPREQALQMLLKAN